MCHRGTTNANARGSSESRRRRRKWLVDTYRANVDAYVARSYTGEVYHVTEFADRLPGCTYAPEPACRCYRCGDLLIAETLTVDRIIPGCHGGTYRRTNIRPACGTCNSETGAPLRSTKRNTRKEITA